MQIYENILETIGNTPLVKLRRFHPIGRDRRRQDRIVQSGRVQQRPDRPRADRAGERQGLLKPGGTIVEPTSGNTGLALAMAAARHGLQAGLHRSRQDLEGEDLAAARVRRGGHHLSRRTSRPTTRARTTRSPSASATSGAPTFRTSTPIQRTPRRTTRRPAPRSGGRRMAASRIGSSGVGTGGTIGGIAKYLKEKNPAIRVIGVDTVGSIYAYYRSTAKLPPADQIHQYLIDGIGEDFMPETVWWDYIDEIVTIDDKTAYRAVFELAQERVDPGRLLGGRRRGGSAPRGREGRPFGARGDALPGFGRALSVEAEPRVVAGEGLARRRHVRLGDTPLFLARLPGYRLAAKKGTVP